MKGPRLHTDDTGYTDHDRFERDEREWSRQEEDRMESNRTDPPTTIHYAHTGTTTITGSDGSNRKIVPVHPAQ